MHQIAGLQRLVKWADAMCTVYDVAMEVRNAIFGLGDQVDQIQKALESGTEIDTTKKHPFYVEGRGWCAAVKLEEGDVLRTKDGKTEVVVDIEVEELDKAVTVYNLEVKDSHTYYVSTNEVLVHNDCGEVASECAKPTQEHHYASDKNSNYTQLFNEIAKKYGLDLDKDWNKDPLPHQGRHPNLYHEFVLEVMKKIDNIAEGDVDIF